MAAKKKSTRKNTTTLSLELDPVHLAFVTEVAKLTQLTPAQVAGVILCTRLVAIRWEKLQQ